MNTKKIILGVVVVILLVLAGLAVNKYVSAPVDGVKNSDNTQTIEAQPSQNTDENKSAAGKVEVKTQGGGGTLTICELRCGDDVCQLESSTELAGVCAETKTDCPQDCK